MFIFLREIPGTDTQFAANGHPKTTLCPTLWVPRPPHPGTSSCRPRGRPAPAQEVKSWGKFYSPMRACGSRGNKNLFLFLGSSFVVAWSLVVGPGGSNVVLLWETSMLARHLLPNAIFRKTIGFSNFGFIENSFLRLGYPNLGGSGHRPTSFHMASL